MFEKKQNFISKNTKLPKYIPVPSILLGGKISSTAVLLYGELLNRATLSQKNNMTDEEGKVYVIYPINQLSLTLGISESQVKKLINELVSNKLLVKKSGGFNKPNHLFLILPSAEIVAIKDSEKATSEGSKSTPLRERKGSTNYYSKTTDESIYKYREGESF